MVGAVKIDAPLAEQKETSGRGWASPKAAGYRDERLLVRRKDVISKHCRVLQSVRNHHRRDMLRVTQFSNEDVYGVSGHGIQPSRGRVVKHYGGLADDRASDRDAPPHSTRQLGRHL